ncbi:hypothetical protein KPL74_13455 [Bacillus sp. NP157]|nr:hypothetical protein KPL74_13455 [Bacillus sp. NP157]
MSNRRAYPCVLLAGMCASAATMASATDRPREVSACDIITSPARYVGQQVKVTGIAYIGMESTNLSDEACAGQKLALQIDEHVAGQSDMLAFRRTLIRSHMRGKATFLGVLTAGSDWRAPYVLHIEHVSRVSPIE